MTHPRVGNRVKMFRTDKKMTQAQLAKMVGIARVSIIAIENGRFLPTIETALHISEVLDVPIERIFWLQDNTK